MNMQFYLYRYYFQKKIIKIDKEHGGDAKFSVAD